MPPRAHQRPLVPWKHGIKFVPAQDVHFFYTRSHLNALQKCALIFSTNFFSLFSHLKNALYNLIIVLCSALKYSRNIRQLFIKFTYSFVAIELLNICKNEKFYFFAQESSRYSVRKQDWFFFAFCVYKNVSQKNWFLYMNDNYNDCHHRKTKRMFLYTQNRKKIAKRFYMQKARHFSKR